MRLYEGMYIVSNELAAEGWEKVEEVVKETITRFDGEVLRIRSWGERLLAYEIDKQESGLYVLTQFNLDPEDVKKVESRVQLSDALLRVLILTVEPAYAEESFAKDPGDEDTAMTRKEDDDEDDYHGRRGGRGNYRDRGRDRDNRGKRDEKKESAAEEKTEKKQPAEEDPSDEKADETEAETEEA